MTASDQRRTGDAVAIAGDYQHRALHSGPAAQRFWHHAKLMAIDSLLPPAVGDFVLDIGCGSGVISDHLATAGATVLALDGSADAIAFARRQYASPAIEFRQALVDDSFEVIRPADKVYCLELIEHIHYPQARQLLENTRRALRPGGQIFLTTPNYRSAWPIIEWIMDRTGVAPQLAGAQHVAHYHGGLLRQLLEESGFEVERLVTKCGAAPWLAPLSWQLAERVQRSELTASNLLGSILVGVARSAHDGPDRHDGEA